MTSTSPIPTHPHTMRGWVILHPRRENNTHLPKGDPARTISEPYVETDYFWVRRWDARKSTNPNPRARYTRAEWQRTYRPDCTMVRATLTLP